MLTPIILPGCLDVTGMSIFSTVITKPEQLSVTLEILGLDINDMLIANLFGFDGLNIYYESSVTSISD
jgi:hypothetical protein